MRTWNLIWILMISLVALPATARVNWFPKDVQDALPDHRTEEVLPEPSVSPAELCTDEDCPRRSPDEELSGEVTASTEELDSEIGEATGTEIQVPEADTIVPSSRSEGIRGPRPPTGVDFEPPSWLESFLDWLKKLTWPDWAGAALKSVGWVLLAALALFALMVLVRAFWPRKQPQIPPDEDSLLNELQARTKNRHATELAQVQDFNLAIHALLLDALRKLESKHPIIRFPAATGREIAREVDPSPESPLLQLVKASEMCVFAVSVADEALYQRAEEWHRMIVGGK